ncbi:polysaccharide biosynthesis tyrosine autokinase [Gordonia sp. UBA7860]|uniref:polysaccharide biosynthesis tyrosine autokinase n=1 Tax=Gordonia sp. UBA7860 TaxID=1946579 RepID=UPI0025802254|nr:polysaccharide biosynthesis tyrosine autokinase [Gordonia sp. UBA7860]
MEIAREVDQSDSALRKVMGVVARRWWIVAMGGLIGAMVGVVSSLFSPTVYEAQTSLYVTAGDDASSASAAYQGTMASQQRVLSYGDLVRSDSVLEGALERLPSTGLAVDQLRSSVRASSQPNTVVLTLFVTSESSEKAVQLSNAVGASLVENVSALESSPTNRQPLAKLTVVTPASGAVVISPNRKRNLGLGLLGGLAIGFIAVIIATKLDNRVGSAADIDALVALPLLSEVPESSSLGVHSLVDFSVGGDAVPEAFRRLRTSLLYSSVDRLVRSVLVTSGSANEGKTTTALNMAASFAELDKRVLLIEADLRRPSFSEKISHSGGAGLTDCLAGQAEFVDLVAELPGASIWVLPAGSRVGNPSELLSSDKARQLFAQLVDQFDYVVVDSPPVLPVCDAVVLAHLVDYTVFVVSEHRTKRSELVASVSAIRGSIGDSGFAGGVVLNRADSRGMSYGYYGSSSDSSSSLSSVSSRTGIV